MNALDLIRSRRSIRKYKPTPVESEKLDQVLEAMRLAPSAGNRQKWLFYVVTDPETRKALGEVTQFPWVAEAPVVLAVCGTDCGVMTNNHRSDTIDLSIALSFGMLTATDLGLGTCWLAHYEEPAARKALGLSEEISVAALMTLGYADEAPDARPRLPLEDVVRRI